MTESKLYRIHADKKTLQSVKEINFSDHNFKERYDIQEWVESTPQILGEDLLIIAKEKTFFEGTNERPDLIAIDKKGNIVILELKRDDSGADVHWQAIKYASYWSRFEINNIIDVYKDYLEKSEGVIYTAEAVQDKILDFIDEEDLDTLNIKQRIILVSHRFSKEVISASKWLIDEYNMDLRCVQLIPYYDNDVNIYNIMSNTLLPLVGIDNLLITPSNSKEYSDGVKGAVRKDDEITLFFENIKDKILNSTKLKYKPAKTSRWAGVANEFRYYHFWFKESYWNNWNMSYKIWRFNDNSKYKFTNQFVLYLTLVKGKLLLEGMTEIQYEMIKNILKSYEDSEFEFEDDEDTDVMILYKVYESDSIDSKMTFDIENDLIKLINDTKEKISSILTGA